MFGGKPAALNPLRITGPSTATRLAEQLGESSGLTSYHLRALSAAGLVEEDVDRGTGRDRWWRAAHDVTSFRSSDVEGTEGAAAAEWLYSYADRSDLYYLATPDELRGLLDAVHELLRAALATTVARRDGHEPVPDGAEHVRLHLLAFPVREAIGVRLTSPDADRSPGTRTEEPADDEHT